MVCHHNCQHTPWIQTQSCQTFSKPAFKPTGGNKEAICSELFFNPIHAVTQNTCSQISIIGRCTVKCHSQWAQISPKQTPTELRSEPDSHFTREDADIWWQRPDTDTGSRWSFDSNHSHHPPALNTLRLCPDKDVRRCLPSSAEVPLIILFPSSRQCKPDVSERHCPVSQYVPLTFYSLSDFHATEAGEQTNVPLTLQKERGFVIQTITTWIFDCSIKGLSCKLAWRCIQRGDLSLSVAVHHSGSNYFRSAENQCVLSALI